MNFIDDVDLVARRRREIAHVVDDFPDVIDASVTGGINLNDIDVPIFPDCLAMDTHTTRIDRGPAATILPDTIERPRDDPRGCGFADPPNAGEDEGLRNSTGLKGVAKSPHHRALPHEQIGERARSVFSGQDPVGLILLC